MKLASCGFAKWMDMLDDFAPNDADSTFEDVQAPESSLEGDGYARFFGKAMPSGELKRNLLF